MPCYADTPPLLPKVSSPQDRKWEWSPLAVARVSARL